MFQLETYKREPVVDRDGKPFEYSSRLLANTAVKHLKVERGVRYWVVEKN